MPPMIGQISLYPYTFAPVGWSFCEGQLLQIAEFEVLFMLLGTKFGGDGQSTFALPNIKPPIANLHYCLSLFGTYNPGIYDAIIGETMVTPAQLAGNLIACNGQMLSQTQYPLLNKYMGTRFGGDGSNFALPTLKSTTTNCQMMIAVQGEPPDNLNARTPYLGEIFLLPNQQTIPAMMVCNGAQLPIQGNNALYSLLGTIFGEGTGTFALPNLTNAAPTGYSYYILVNEGVYPNQP